MSQSKSKPKSPSSAGSRYLVAVIGVVTILLIGLTYWAWTDTPQLADDDDVYASLDALFTAVTARREPLIVNCESKLVVLHSEGKIPEQAWTRISHVIELAKAGQWESSARELYRFIERQKRTKPAHFGMFDIRDTMKHSSLARTVCSGSAIACVGCWSTQVQRVMAEGYCLCAAR